MKYFTISEMLYSHTAVKRGIWNGCNREQEDNLVALVDNVLDPARQRYGRVIHVNSGYRCLQLNTLIHGALQSQHLQGEAADLTTDAGPQGNLELAKVIIGLGHFDQLILENVPGTSLMPQWLHVSWRRNGRNRGEIRKKVAGCSQHPLLTAAELSEVRGLRSDVRGNSGRTAV